MGVTSRIPREPAGFSAYITNTNAYQLTGSPANYTRWGWTPAESAQWTAFATKFAPLFAKYSDKKGSRTTDVTEQVHQLIASCIAYDQEHHLLDRIAASPNSVNTDFTTFNLKRGTPLAKTTKTHPTVPLAEQCYPTLVALGGGGIAVGCRTSHDSGRACKAAGADSVKVFFKIGDPVPANATDGTQTDTFPKATFTMQCGAANAGKKLYLFAQWYTSRQPELAGPIGALQTILIA